MSSFRPIAGNESFSVVENVAGAVKNLDLSEGKIDSLSAGSLNLVGVGLTDAGSQPGRGVLYRAVGYLPYVNTITGGANGTVFLNNRPNVGLQANSGVGANVNSELLLLPNNAIINQVTIINNSRDANGDLTDLTLTGTPLGIDLGLGNAQTATLATTGGGAELKDAAGTDIPAVAGTGINAAPYVLRASAAGANNVLAGTGAPADEALVQVAGDGSQNGVTLTVNEATAVLGCGTNQVVTDPQRGLHIVVVIDYLMPGTGYVPGPVASAKWDADASAIVP